MSFLKGIPDPHRIITAIDLSNRFPEVLGAAMARYREDIERFRGLVNRATDSAHLLGLIRSTEFSAQERMALLKIFRRSVAPIVDTEMAKKISVPTERLVLSYGDTFKPIALIRQQFNSLTEVEVAALAALIGEYDTRGQLGYHLTARFFEWFDNRFKGEFLISGPRGAGRDVELNTVFPEYQGKYPCDFVIRDANAHPLAVGFARYDSTRGGAQSDDRTGGNADKVSKAAAFSAAYGKAFRILFLADGPGLAHRDTWEEACKLDGASDGVVRVTTLITAPERVTSSWLRGGD